MKVLQQNSIVSGMPLGPESVQAFEALYRYRICWKPTEELTKLTAELQEAAELSQAGVELFYLVDPGLHKNR